MASPAGTGPHTPDEPPGWPGDDPTVPDELAALAGQPTGPRRRRAPGAVRGRVLELTRPDAGRAGVQPAGRVLVVMVAALVLAMFLNADALVERAERKPLGRERDRALAVWHPVQDVSHALQLHRVRQFADWVAGETGNRDDAQQDFEDLLPLGDTFPANTTDPSWTSS